MHIPTCNALRSPALLTSFLRQHPLGLLITSQPSANQPDLQASHIPWVIDVPLELETLVHEARNEWDEGVPVQARDTDKPIEDGNTDAWDAWKGKVKLRGHMARANPQAKALLAALSNSSSTTPLSIPVLIVFTLPSHTYISPSFYTSTKPATGKVVPTWDYAAIEVHGRLSLPPPTASSSTPSESFLYNQMTALTNQEERKVGGEWKVDDAPEGYRKVLERAVIGLRVEIESMEGRWKLSQEKNSGDWNGVVNGVKSINPTTQNASSEPDNIVNLVEKAGWRWGQDRESK